MPQTLEDKVVEMIEAYLKDGKEGIRRIGQKRNQEYEEKKAKE